ncbi:metallophosphoesterase [uncultured Sphingomonas sp.]|uniref:metallophosphoesterase n=1 Tax=uncultured Sphingomonas sp. TaxID=158754 RepID=UPI003747B7A4
MGERIRFRYAQAMRVLLRLVIAAALFGLALLGWMFAEARQTPVVRRATVELPGWPASAAPMTVAVIGDIHIGSIAMDAARLTRIVAQINALRPDVVVLAGDFIAGHDIGLSTDRAPLLVAPLKRLTPRIGTVAVMGNHDHWTGIGPVRAALAAAGVIILDNQTQRFGALTVVGLDDRYTKHDRIGAAMAAARALPGPRLLVSHGPDVVPDLPADVPLVVTSHTHCGQIVLPLYGPLEIPSAYGAHYLCGVVREGGRATIVGAGVGTSVLPLRLNAPPDIWLLTLWGANRAQR